MKVLILLGLLQFMIEECWAEFNLAPGAGLTLPHVSQQVDARGEDLISFDQGLGLALDVEYRLGLFSLNIGALWRGSEAVTQYFYTNPKDPFDTAAAQDLKTNTTTLMGYFGPRLRLLDLKYYKIFLGAGLARGMLYLTFNEDQFVLSTGSKTGFREGEDRDLEGHYYEGGLDIQSRRGGALRFLVRHTDVKSMPFTTLSDRRIVLITTELTVQYVHPF